MRLDKTCEKKIFSSCSPCTNKMTSLNISKGFHPHEENLFLKNLEGLDLKLVFELHKKFSLGDCTLLR